MANTYQTYGTCALEARNAQSGLHPKVVQFAQPEQEQCCSKHLVMHALFDSTIRYEPYDLAALSPKTKSEKIKCAIGAGVPIALMFLGILAPAFL